MASTRRRRAPLRWSFDVQVSNTATARKYHEAECQEHFCWEKKVPETQPRQPLFVCGFDHRPVNGAVVTFAVSRRQIRSADSLLSGLNLG
jgi:hypothetical protein